MADEKTTTSDTQVLKTTVPVEVSIDPIFETQEKIDFGIAIDSSDDSETKSHEEPQYDFKSEEFANIPEIVRNVVSFQDDPSLPVLTFRSIVLSVIFCTIGSIVSQIS